MEMILLQRVLGEMFKSCPRAQVKAWMRRSSPRQKTHTPQDPAHRPSGGTATGPDDLGDADNHGGAEDGQHRRDHQDNLDDL